MINLKITLCQTNLEKFGWFCFVCLGFLGAGVLIHSSYSQWQESPIATTITTHPLDNLDFPIVTVCPPKGSNTALFADLVRFDNTSLDAGWHKLWQAGKWLARTNHPRSSQSLVLGPRSSIFSPQSSVLNPSLPSPRSSILCLESSIPGPQSPILTPQGRQPHNY